MAVLKTLFYNCVVLVIAHEITAQSPGFQFPSFSTSNSGSFGGLLFPNFPGLGGSSGQSGSGLFAFPFQFPSLPGFPSLPVLGGLGRPSSTTSAPQNSSAEAGSRKRREAESESDSEESADHQNRLFFSLFPTITSCNYTTQAGSTCPTCRQALRCLPNNVGILTTCAGFFRNCNNGRCSLFQTAACANSTSG